MHGLIGGMWIKESIGVLHEQLVTIVSRVVGAERIIVLLGRSRVIIGHHDAGL